MINWLLATSDLTTLDYISRAGVIVLLIIIIYGGYKKWWVFGWQYKECVDEKNEWKEAALKSTHTAESAVAAGETLVHHVVRNGG